MNALRLVLWMKHPWWTIREFTSHPLTATRNGTKIVVCFLLTAFFGTLAIFHLLLKTLRGRRENVACLFLYAKPWARTVLRVAGVPVEVIGVENIEWERPYIIAANHQSTLDILALAAAIRTHFRFVIKKEVGKYPFVGWATKLAGQIFIDRRDHVQAVGAINAAIARDATSSILFFTEGHRTRTRKLEPFQMGAFHTASETGWPILPVALSGGCDILEKGSLVKFRAGRNIKLVFCPIISNTKDGDPKKLRERTRSIINLHLEPPYRDPSLPCIVAVERGVLP